MSPSPASSPAYNTPNYLNAAKGVRSWLTTLDRQAHRRHVPRCSTLVGFFLGGVFALLVRHRAAHARARRSWTR